MKIQKIAIYGLNNIQVIEIPIKDNKLILIAENGAGKTTILRMIFLFLSKNWLKLSEYNFDKMTITIDDISHSIDKSSLIKDKITKQDLHEEIKKYPLYKNFLTEVFKNYSVEDLLKNTYLIGDIENKYDIPTSILLSILDSLKKLGFDENLYLWNYNILYLPTYRRIERKFRSLYGDLSKRLQQHLRRIVPEIETIINQETEENDGVSALENDLLSLFDDLWSVRDNEKWIRKKDSCSQVELVEFGMDDVKYRISDYLTNKNIEKKYFDIYLSVCNRYLGDKKQLILTSHGTSLQVLSLKDQKALPLDCLSAGEKQIISLFSHLLLDRDTIVIFDEPEISISMKWQEMLLEDISKFDPLGLITATHSPFIVTDSFREYTHGLNEFISE
ncbi:Predicted ATP-binding protein involved in virulence [Pedobacter terrae]|uniref:Predicted ATP-binding protein involved in virulence n=1 Tax=Pedobacter terrae TaxID=405671 RepID=A0A1G7VIU6_9SPHI|nr:AAA family ATPase [Pedobacter terrae]SDG59664.1 Predicted ATP-binding protein involved in virulence [Pedobacter terrae]